MSVKFLGKIANITMDADFCVIEENKKSTVAQENGQPDLFELFMECHGEQIHQEIKKQCPNIYTEWVDWSITLCFDDEDNTAGKAEVPKVFAILSGLEETFLTNCNFKY